VTPKNNKALFFGDVAGTHLKLARTGDRARDPDGAAPATGPVWSSFVAHSLNNWVDTNPVFVAKLAGEGVTAKNNMGIWGLDSSGFLRRMLRTGDMLGTQKVRSFTVLKPVSRAPSAARSVNATGSVAALVKFTDGKQALVKVTLP
jgi:hypothetical protein